MAYEITRTYEFSSAHILEGHPRCGRLHGHNYKLEVTLVSSKLTNGMVMDFQDVDAMVKPMVDYLDHRFISSDENDMMLAPTWMAAVGMQRSTAECLAAYFYAYIQPKLPTGIDVKEISIYETSRSKATYRP